MRETCIRETCIMFHVSQKQHTPVLWKANGDSDVAERLATKNRTPDSRNELRYESRQQRSDTGLTENFTLRVKAGKIGHRPQETIDAKSRSCKYRPQA